MRLTIVKHKDQTTLEGKKDNFLDDPALQDLSLVITWRDATISVHLKARHLGSGPRTDPGSVSLRASQCQSLCLALRCPI